MDVEKSFEESFEDDKEELIELAESLKQKHGIKNIKIHYEDLPKPYWLIETQVIEQHDGKCQIKGCDNPLFTNHRCSKHMD